MSKYVVAVLFALLASFLTLAPARADGVPPAPAAPPAVLAPNPTSPPAPFPFMTIGVGTPPVTINLKTGALGFFDQTGLVQVSLNLAQRQVGAYQVSLWAPSLGIILSHPQGGNFRFGASLVPLEIRAGSFSFGVGVAYVAEDVAQAKLQNLSLVFPFTYSTSLLD